MHIACTQITLKTNVKMISWNNIEIMPWWMMLRCHTMYVHVKLAHAQRKYMNVHTWKIWHPSSWHYPDVISVHYFSLDVNYKHENSNLTEIFEELVLCLLILLVLLPLGRFLGVPWFSIFVICDASFSLVEKCR